MSVSRVFDAKHYQSYNQAREKAIQTALSEFHGQVSFGTGLDVGCGLGYFSALMSAIGLQVTALDGRKDNVEEAARRVPNVNFRVGDIEAQGSAELGRFDLVFCLGLLYHLENPLRAIRNLYSVTEKVLVVESMCAPGVEPSMELLDEYHAEDQGLNYLAFYPTESCLVKMLYRAGFPFVLGFTTPPGHADFHSTKIRRKARTMLIASHIQLNAPSLKILAEPVRPWDIWPVPKKPWQLEVRRLARIGRNLITGGNSTTRHPNKTNLTGEEVE